MPAQARTGLLETAATMGLTAMASQMAEVLAHAG
jgi:hypothetical protein